MKKIINAQNWTGEKIAYEKTSTGIELYDMTFAIEKMPTLEGLPELERYKVTEYSLLEVDSSFSFEISRWSDQEPFMASQFDVVREGYEVDEVAAAMVANLY